jgi:hypothetical protein
MRRSPAVLLLTAIACAQAAAAGRPPRREIDNVVAFARLYGVVRYFYPSDAAAGLDWNRFVVRGVSLTRVAADPRRLETALKELFEPLGPGIEIGAKLTPAGAAGQPNPDLIAWRYIGPGLSGARRPYSAKRTHRSQTNTAGIDGFVTLMQTAPAAALRGKTIRLRGQVRARASDGSGSAALWLRVDRESRSPGFFDNMGNRPIREAAWHPYEIEGTVADDAANVAFGVMASGPVTADFDAIELAVRDAVSDWVPIPIRDAGFEAGPAAASKGWSRAGSSGNAVIARPVEGAPEGKQFVRFSAPAVPAAQAELFEEAAPTNGAHVDLDLGSGLKARIPLALTDSQARAATNSANADAAGPDSASLAVSTRLADVVVAWNVFRHFYPYWSETGVDWNARLRPHLEGAYVAETRDDEGNVLRYLVADARDGHGSVSDMRRTDPPGLMPIRLRAIGNRIVVTASTSPSETPVGAVVSAINGTPAGQRLAAAMRLASGTTQWKEARALQEIATCATGKTVTLMVDSGSGPGESKVTCGTSPPPMEKRPQPVTEVAPAVWYVDLTRQSMADLTSSMEKLSTAAGVIFDVRGYPTDAGVQVLRHLLTGPDTDRWMHVARITGPSGQIAGWQSVGWDLTPVSPRFSGKIVFMTDGRAISYAESVMGYVADRKLGTIIGSTTAGTNGNVVGFELPGAFAITFTGMRVTRHDGRSPYHLAGTSPDIPVEPTIAGLRAGRDEVLERAIAFIRAR